MFGDEMDTIGIPAALDMQAMGITAAAAVADAFRRGDVL
jgi:hypothetical protein